MDDFQDICGSCGLPDGEGFGDCLECSTQRWAAEEHEEQWALWHDPAPELAEFVAAGEKRGFCDGCGEHGPLSHMAYRHFCRECDPHRAPEQPMFKAVGFLEIDVTG